MDITRKAYCGSGQQGTYAKKAGPFKCEGEALT